MIRLILADDEIETRNNVIACIDWEYHGLEIVGVADNGDMAMELICQVKPDVAILDIYMPGRTGLDVIAQIRGQMDDPPAFIIISGYDEFTYAQQSIRLKVEEYLLKPFRPQDLLQAVQRAVWQAEAAKSADPNDFYSFLRTCQSAPQKGNISSSRYAVEAERKVLSAIAVGTQQDVQDSVNVFMHQCVRGQPVAEALNHVEMLRIEIHRLLMERCKNPARMDMFTGQPWTFDNVYGQLDTALSRMACAANEQIAVSQKRSTVIMRAVEYIEQNYTESITLRQVADSVYVSPSYLSNLFREKMGVNLTAYIHKLRIEKAKELLLDPEQRISTVAEAVGYNCEKHFLQKFKQITGVTPSQFRFKKSR